MHKIEQEIRKVFIHELNPLYSICAIISYFHPHRVVDGDDGCCVQQDVVVADSCRPPEATLNVVRGDNFTGECVTCLTSR